MLAAATTQAVAPTTPMRPDQVLATLNGWMARGGGGTFVRVAKPGASSVRACTGERLCLEQDVDGAAVRRLFLSGDVATADRSRRYLELQSMLVALTAPGAPYRPVVTADRLAVGDGRPVDAQLGPICLHVTKAGPVLQSAFVRARCDAP